MHVSVKILILISFLVASVSDVRKLKIPNTTHVILIAAGVLNILTGGIDFFHALRSFGIVLAACAMLIMTFDPFGGGDYKLIACAAFTIGLSKSVHGLTIAFLLAGIYALQLKLRKKYDKTARIPLAPFLAAGYAVMII